MDRFRYRRTAREEFGKLRSLAVLVAVFGCAALSLTEVAAAQASDGQASGRQSAHPRRDKHVRIQKAPSSATPPAAATPQAAEIARLASFDRLAEKGWDIPMPGYADTVLQDTGGVRSKLAEHGIAFTYLSLNAFSANVQNNAPSSPQSYAGQRPTASSDNYYTLTYDLGRLGDPGAQLVVGGSFNATTWEPLGPRGLKLSRLAVYQPIFGDLLAVKFGFLTNDLHYIGTSVGGSLAGGSLGPSALLPFQAGLARLNIPAPAFNVISQLPGGLYYRGGAQRSISPDGANAEDKSNPTGLRFSVPGASVLTIQEVGYQRHPSPNGHAMWLRVGGIYNNTKYFDFQTLSRDTNSVIFAAADYQAASFSSELPFQGLYAGATYMKSPAAVNVFKDYWEGRVYAIGLLPSRPLDFTTLVFTRTGISDDYRRFLMATTGSDTRNANIGITLSHTFRVYSGVYIAPGIGYTINPSPVRKLDNCLRLLLNANVFF